MKKAIWRILLVAVLGWTAGAGAGLAQPLDDCSLVCNSQSMCGTSCQDGGIWTTCGYYGPCDQDPDDDFVYGNDNCPNTYNPGQADCDSDGTGDACDSQNVTWQAISGPDTCHIYDRQHFGYVDVTLVAETLLMDVSACYGDPEYGVQRYESRAVCAGFDGWGCCVDNFGLDACFSYYGNNQCVSG